MYRKLGGSQSRSGHVRKISPTPGFDPRTVQPVASSYTDWAIPARRNSKFGKNPTISSTLHEDLNTFCSVDGSTDILQLDDRAHATYSWISMPTLNTFVLLTPTIYQQKFKGNVLLPFDGNNGHANAPECTLSFSLSWSTFHSYYPYFYTPINYLMPIPVAAPSKACLRAIAFWDCGFESRRRHRNLSLVSVVCCQVEIPASDWSLVQRSRTECGVSSKCDREAP
jgi:hypothetical protein